MGAMPGQRVQIPCGQAMVPVTVDHRTEVVKQELSTPVEPRPDLSAAVAAALARPLDRPPLSELARPGMRVTIAFDDPTVPCFAPVWETALGQMIEQLTGAGVAEERITLLCANALHRKFTREELRRILGRRLVERFGRRLVCHDAEDPDGLVHLGRTEGGHEVELSRLAVEADLCLYLNTSCWRAFNGGWKSICVGLSSYRSIRAHHTPEIMSMSTEGNRMHAILDEMGALVCERVGAERFFKVETVLANPMQVGRIWAGSVDACRREVLALQAERGTSRRDLLRERAEIVCYGVPAWSPYAAFSTMNPLLTLVSTALGYLGGVIEALGQPGCSVVLATPCPDQWDEARHASYPEVWNEVLPLTLDPGEIRRRFADAFAARQDYIHKYRHEHAFHPVHGIMATFPLKRLRHASRVYVAHAEAPHLVQHLGFVAAPTVDEAIARARAERGADASVAVVRYPMALNR
jgi:hypothetical protein